MKKKIIPILNFGTVESFENPIALKAVTDLVMGKIIGEILGVRKMGLVSFIIKYPEKRNWGKVGIFGFL